MVACISYIMKKTLTDNLEAPRCYGIGNKINYEKKIINGYHRSKVW